MKKIPFVDLKAQYASIKSEIDAAIENVIKDTAFIKGKYVTQFEEDFKKFYGIENFISCANGTDAIYIALKCLGVGPGDEVITVANTWISTAETICQVGAKPVFVDIDPDYYTIDTNKIEEKITPKTKAIIPVHLFGQPCDMDAIINICQEYNLLLIEDCAQAHFAEWNGKKVGTFGDVGTFSFFPGKNLGAYGDAGGIITNNKDLAVQIKMYANHGAITKHHHEILGINSRLDGLQAAILSVKLKHIHRWTESRIKIAEYYSNLLEGKTNIVLPAVNKSGRHVFHLFVIRVDHRINLQINLKKYGIETGIHYPTPLPFLKAFKYLKYNPNDFPVAYSYMDNILSLPMYPEIKKSQIDFIVDKI